MRHPAPSTMPPPVEMLYISSVIKQEPKWRFMKTYTIDQIKKAFWANFHESGELWFNYFDDDLQNQKSTEAEWNRFCEELKAATQ